jgi:carbonic anhydrase
MFKTFFLLLTFIINCLIATEKSGLNRLIDGNNRYRKDALQHPNRTPERRESVACKQEPFAIIVGCSDSRVSPEIIFDQGVGDLFVIRVAGNVIGPLELDSIDYAALHLHSCIILILGHERCGAVNAVIQGTTQDIQSLSALIQPAVKEERKKKPPHLLEACIKTNALNMKNYLLTTNVVKKLISEKKLEVYAGYYDLDTGSVEILKN